MRARLWRSWARAPPRLSAMRAYRSSRRRSIFSWLASRRLSCSSTGSSAGSSLASVISRTACSSSSTRRCRSCLAVEEGGLLFARGEEAGMGRPELLHLRGAVPVAVQQLAVVVGRQQRLVLVLAVHVEQQAGELPQAGQGERRILHEQGPLAVAPHAAPYDDGPLLRLDALGLEPGQGLLVALQADHPRHAGLLGAGPHGLRVGLEAQQQPQGPDQDGLPRPGLAGEDVQPRGEAHLQPLDEGVVGHHQGLKHSAAPPS